MGSSDRQKAFAFGVLSMAAIFFSSHFSLRVFSTPDDLPMIWLPTGIILSLLLVTTGAAQLSVLLGAFAGGMLFNYIRFQSIPMSILISVLFCARAVAGAFLLKGFSAKRFSFEKASDLSRLIVYPIVIVGPVFSFCNAILLSSEYGVSFFTYWARWWLVSSLGVIVVVPWAVSWSRISVSRSLPIRVILETATLIAAVGLIFLFLHAHADDVVAHWMYTMGIVPILMLAALRFDLRGVSFVLLVVTLMSLFLISGVLGAHTDHGSAYQKAIIGMQFSLLLAAIFTQGYNVVVVERREAESLVRLQSATMNAAANAIAIADAKGTTRYVNDAYAKSVGLAADALVGQGIHLLWSVPPPRHESAEPWSSILSGKVWCGETRCVHDDGTESLEKLTITPIQSAGGQISHFVSIGEDVTERRRAEKALSVSREQLKGLSHRLLVTQESERRLLALELHDGIGQSLSAVKINLGTLRQAADISVVHSRLDDSGLLIDQAINEIRSLAHELRPAILDDLGLVPAIRWHVDGVARRTKINGTFSCRGVNERLDSDIETACFRIVQEGLNNMQKHSAARTFSVKLHEDPTVLRLSVTDDGKGFNVREALDAGSRSRSFGLLGMKERAVLVGGKVEITSQLGHGSAIEAVFPLIRRKETEHERNSSSPS